MSWASELFAFRSSSFAFRAGFQTLSTGKRITLRPMGARSFLAKSEQRKAKREERKACGNGPHETVPARGLSVNHLLQFSRPVTFITFRGDWNHGSKPVKSRHLSVASEGSARAVLLLPWAHAEKKEGQTCCSHIGW